MIEPEEWPELTDDPDEWMPPVDRGLADMEMEL